MCVLSRSDGLVLFRARMVFRTAPNGTVIGSHYGVCRSGSVVRVESTSRAVEFILISNYDYPIRSLWHSKPIC